MKKLLTVLILGGSVSALGANFYGSAQLEGHKSNALSLSGSADLKKVGAKKLTVSGSLTFVDLAVRHTAKISGSAQGIGLTCQNLKVSGSLTGEKLEISQALEVSGSLIAKDITVGGNTTLSGGLEITKGIFKGSLDASSEEVHLTDTDLQKLTIHKPWSKKVQKVFLKGKTIVHGDIVFDGGQGEVHADPTVILKGKIIGGTKSSS